jgi:transposase-like protein
MSEATTQGASCASASVLFDNWFDPIEDCLRAKVRGFIETLLEEELAAALARPRYGRGQPHGAQAAIAGHRHGHCRRALTGTFCRMEISVPRARIRTGSGATAEWTSQALRAYQRRTLAADAPIGGAYLAGTNTRRVRRARRCSPMASARMW